MNRLHSWVRLFSTLFAFLISFLPNDKQNFSINVTATVFFLPKTKQTFNQTNKTLMIYISYCSFRILNEEYM